MKAKTLVAVTTLLMSPGLVLAADQTQDHKARHPDSGAATTQGAPPTAGGGMSMMPMHEHMQKMRAQMAEIHRTEDPDKRDELIKSHMSDMQDMMKMMQSMHGGKPMMGQGGMMDQGMGLKGGKMMGGQQGDKKSAPQGGMMGQDMGMQGKPGGRMMGGGPQSDMMGMRMMEMMDRQQMMEQRMDMMQMMMDQMIENRAASEETRMIRERRHDHRKTK